jgi:chromosome segregation ATPase
MFAQIRVYLLGVAIIAAFGAGWGVNNWRMTAKLDALKLAYETALNTSIEKARQTEQEWESTLNQERDNATKREIQLRADADNADAASDRLRDQLSETARRIAQAPASACAAYVEKLSDVLSESTTEYTRLAEQTDRWESYAVMCHDSWPK